MSWLTSVIFVVAAVFVGTFFVAMAYFSDAAESWGREGRRASGFVLVYSLALAGGFLVQVVFAVLLRWVTQATRLTGMASWILFGAALGFVVPWTLARLGYLVEGLYFPADLQSLKRAVMFPLAGAMMYAVQPAWISASVGGATGAALRLLATMLENWSVRQRARGGHLDSFSSTQAGFDRASGQRRR
jgi:MFS family permease